MRTRVPTVVVALSLAAVSGSAVAQERVDRRAEEQRIRELDRRWVEAVAAGDVETIANLYASNGRLLPPNAPPAEGREAIGQWWRGFLGLPDLSLTFEPTEIGVAEAGDLAYDTGTYSLGFTGEEGPVREEGKYLQVWNKVDGEWQLVADMFSGNAALP